MQLPEIFVGLGALMVLGATRVTAEPVQGIPAAADRAFSGALQVTADASNVERRIIHVHERVSALRGDTILWYPKWLPGSHAPEGPIDRVAGLRMRADGKAVTWRRDPVQIYAFHVHMPTGARALEIDFDYLSPTSERVGGAQMSRDLLMLEWNDLLLYPAGYHASRIPVAASLTLPAGWTLGTALEAQSRDGARTSFAQVSLETLVDSPVFAGRHVRRFELDAATHVSLNVFADRSELLEARPEELAKHRALIAQAYKLFGARHYAHYDFLLALTDALPGIGIEHHQSSENAIDPTYFLDWDGTPYGHDLLAHEYTHSWNGKFRRPADLWTPSYEVPMQNSLLWVYEGQTQYWGLMLAARAGLWSKQQLLDVLAEMAAYYSTLPGRAWRPLADTTNDEIINPRRPMSWESWQRFEDYYEEGALYWLEADALIRERSHGRRSLDDFAKRFFGVEDGRITPLTYTFDDVVAALNAVEPYDWAAFLHARLEHLNGATASLEGLRHAGYELVFDATQSEYQKTAETQRKQVSLTYSLGLEAEDKDGTIKTVLWNGPAFQAGVTEGMQLLAVDGIEYSSDLLKQAVAAAGRSKTPIELILKSGNRYVVAKVSYAGGLRYPHLKRLDAAAALLDDIAAART